ncbi:hypothetical protein V6N13_138728 [Hibiscus sabdariffa]
MSYLVRPTSFEPSSGLRRFSTAFGKFGSGDRREFDRPFVSAVRSAQFREPVITGSGVVVEQTRYLLDCHDLLLRSMPVVTVYTLLNILYYVTLCNGSIRPCSGDRREFDRPFFSAVRSAQFREPVITGSGVVVEQTRYLLDCHDLLLRYS